MINMDASLREFYEKKIQRLQLEMIQMQEHLYARPMDQYKLKYQLLLVKLAEENQLREGRQLEEQQYKEKNIDDMTTKWQTVLKERAMESQTRIDSLQDENKALSVKVTELEMKLARLHKEFDQGDSEVMKLRLQSVKKENERLRKQIGEAYANCDQKIVQVKKEVDVMIEEIKEREKICYRDQIGELQRKIAQLEVELQTANQKANPKRQAKLFEIQQSLFKQKQQHLQQIQKMSKLLEKRNQEISQLKAQTERREKQYVNTIKQQSDQLKKYERQLFEKSFEREMELAELQKDMGSKRQKEADELKWELSRVEGAFERERSEWKHIIQQFQTENGKIKKDWQEEKLKYIQEKKRLKEKITELRSRLKQRDDEANKDQNGKMLKSMKELNMSEEHLSNYENAITFMDRQVRKAAIKIQEKDREIGTLLQELKLLQQQSQKEIAYTRQKTRQELKNLYDKIFDLQDQYDRVSVELKEREKSMRKRENEMQVEREGHRIEIDNLKRTIEEMQRDYDRVTQNKKTLQESYREERENVITGKLDINQQRKKKWTELGRQQKQLQLVYREKMNQMQSKHEIEVDKLTREKHQAHVERSELKAEVQLLKERLGIQNEQDNKENRYADYQAKLATLDLEIALTQDLFKSLTSTMARVQPRQKTQLDLLSERASEHVNSSSQQGFEEMIEISSPGWASSREDNLKGTAFSFFPIPRQL